MTRNIDAYESATEEDKVCYAKIGVKKEDVPREENLRVKNLGLRDLGSVF